MCSTVNFSVYLTSRWFVRRRLSPPLPSIYTNSTKVWQSLSLCGKNQQLLLNIHERRQLVPCPFTFLIKPQTPGTIVSATRGESERSMAPVERKFGQKGAEFKTQLCETQTFKDPDDPLKEQPSLLSST